ncbi:MAG: hypothetical protein GY719_13865 [bacterium]|nr:hypothetical protein [bacterium]
MSLSVLVLIACGGDQRQGSDDGSRRGVASLGYLTLDDEEVEAVKEAADHVIFPTSKARFLAQARLPADALERRLQHGLSVIGGTGARYNYHLNDACRLAIFLDVGAPPGEIMGAEVNCSDGSAE